MAISYSKKTWKNRTTEYPNRYTMTSTNGNIADVAIVPKEGNVTQAGDKFDAATMNDLETRINNGFNSAQSTLSNTDTTLRGLISTEHTRALGQEQLIWHDVNANTSGLAAEISRAQSAEGTLTTNLANEISRATGIETGLRNDMTALQGRMTNTESDVDTLTSRISALETDIDLETARAEGVENTLSNNISTLTINLNAEVSRAQNAETTLKNYVDEKLSTTYKASGSIYFADLPALAMSRVGNVYNIKDDFTTTAQFLEGAGKNFPAGTNVGISLVDGAYYAEVTPEGTENPSEEGWYESQTVGTSTNYVLTEDTTVVSGKTYYEYSTQALFYDVMVGFIDTSNFVEKTDKATLSNLGLSKPDGTSITIDPDGTLHSYGGQGSAEAAQRMIAPIEPDGTSSLRAYAIGRRLILNDILYKATSTIAVGDALVVGTNIEAANTITDFDTTPTSGSTKFVTSGGVYSYIDTMITQAIAASY